MRETEPAPEALAQELATPVSNERVVTFILAGGRGQRLDPLTSDHPKPMVSAGGRYKLIDFTLNNCLNSSLANIYVLVQHLSAELITHVHDGWRPYFPATRGDNLQAVPPQFAQGEQGYQGTADALRQNRPLIEQAKADYVVVLAGDHIYKMDYRRMIAFHQSCGADVTVAAIEVPIHLGRQFGVIQVDTAGRIANFAEKPENPVPLPGNPGRCLVSMGIYVFTTDRLLDGLQRDADQPGSTHDLGRDLVPALARSGGAWVFRFSEADRNVRPYWRDVGTLDAYYDANLDLTAINPEFDLYDAEWPIRTVPLVAPPPKFVHDEPGRTGMAVNSIVSPGCIVSGARVVRSILGANGRLHSWALVEDSVLLDGVQVGRRARVRRAILDRGVWIPADEIVGHDSARDRERFLVTPNGVTVVSRAAAELIWPGAP